MALNMYPSSAIHPGIWLKSEPTIELTPPPTSYPPGTFNIARSVSSVGLPPSPAPCGTPMGKGVLQAVPENFTRLA